MALEATGLLDTPAKEAVKTPNPGRDFMNAFAEVLFSPFEAVSGVNFWNPTYSSNAGQNIGTAIGGTANAVADVLGAVYGGPAYGAIKAGVSGAADAAGAQDTQPINHIAQYGGKIKKYQADTTVSPVSYPFNMKFTQDFYNQEDYQTFQNYAKFMMDNYPYKQNLPGYTAPPTGNTSTGYPIDNIDTSGLPTPPFIYEPIPGNNTGGTTMGNVGGTTTMPGNTPGGANLGGTSFENSKLIGNSKGGYNTSKTAGQGWQNALGSADLGNIANIGSAIAGIGGEENKRTLLDSGDYRDMRKEHDNTGASAIASIGRIWSNKTPQQNLFNKTWEDQISKYKNRSGVRVKQHHASDLGPMQSAQFGGNWGGGTAGFPGSANANKMPLGMPMQNPTDRIYQNQAMEKASGGGNDWGTKVGETMGLVGDSLAQVFGGAGMGGGGGGMGGMFGGGGGESGGGMMDMIGGMIGGGGEGGGEGMMGMLGGLMGQYGGRVPSYQTIGQVQPNYYDTSEQLNKEMPWKKLNAFDKTDFFDRGEKIAMMNNPNTPRYMPSGNPEIENKLSNVLDPGGVNDPYDEGGASNMYNYYEHDKLRKEGEPAYPRNPQQEAAIAERKRRTDAMNARAASTFEKTKRSLPKEKRAYQNLTQRDLDVAFPPGSIPKKQTGDRIQPLGADNVYESEQAVQKETDSKKLKEQLKFLKDLESRESNSNKGTLKGANNKLQEWWGTPQEYEVDGKPYLTSPRQEFSRIGLEGTGTFTSAGGPGVGVRSYFPYSDPLGVGIETDIDPTGPGGGVLLSNHRLRQAKNSVLKALGMEKDTSEVMPGFLYGGVEMAGSLPTPFLGLTTSLHDLDKLEDWTDKPENSTYKSVAEGVEKGMGPFLAAWDSPGKLFKDSYLFPKGVHNPLSGSRIGLGGVEGLKGGNIIPDYKYLSLAGGNASVAE